MKIKQLINKLSLLDENLEVFVQGYEYGYIPLDNFSEIEEMVKRNDRAMYGGQWEKNFAGINIGEEYFDFKNKIKGIVLER